YDVRRRKYRHQKQHRREQSATEEPEHFLRPHPFPRYAAFGGPADDHQEGEEEDQTTLEQHHPPCAQDGDQLAVYDRVSHALRLLRRPPAADAVRASTRRETGSPRGQTS